MRHTNVICYREKMKKPGREKRRWLSDGYLLIVILHVLFIWRQRRHQPEEAFVHRVFNLPSFLLTLVILTLIYSPVWAYFNQIPKAISIDGENRQLSIVRKRRSKSRALQLDSISFHFQQSALYSVLSIYSHFYRLERSEAQEEFGDDDGPGVRAFIQFTRPG